MKQVLLIDASPIFMEFLKDKLLSEKIKVETAAGNRDAFQKMVNLMPDLVIVDVESDITFRTSLTTRFQSLMPPNFP